MANQDRDKEEKHRVQNTLMEHKIFQKPKTNRTRRQKPSTLPITTTTTSTKIESRIDTGTTIRSIFRTTTQPSSEDLPSLPKTTIKTKISTKIIPFKADLKVEPMNGLNDSSPTFKQASLFPVKNHENSSNSNYHSVHFIVFGLLHLIVILVF